MDTPEAISSPSSSLSTSSSTTTWLELANNITPTPVDENATTFEDYINDDATMKVADKYINILGAYYGVVSDFNLDLPPYNVLMKTQVPTQSMLKRR